MSPELREGSAMSVATAFSFLSTTIMTSTAFFKRERLARMLIFVQNDIDKLLQISDESEAKLFKKMHKYLRRVTAIVWTAAGTGALITYLEAFYRVIAESIFNFKFDDRLPRLLNRLFPFQKIHDDLFFRTILPVYVLFIGVIIVLVWHTFITSLMGYVILKWQIMHKRLRDMDVSKVSLEPNEGKYYSSLEGEDQKLNYLRTRMCKFCVIEQIRIRWFVNELRELIGFPVFADFIIFSILICFLFYELATANPTKMDFVFMILYLFVMSSILWLYHWHATLMKEYSQEMGFAIYSCDWYNYPVKVQKLIQMVMIITARPLEITAVLVPLSLTTFIDIIRAAYSYFSLLRNSSSR